MAPVIARVPIYRQRHARLPMAGFSIMLLVIAMGSKAQDGDSVMYDNIHDNNRGFVDLTYRF